MKSGPDDTGHAAQVAAHTVGEFWQRLASAPQALLMLDYDGTLAPFTPDRHSAWPYPGVDEALAALAGTQTRVVLISGRPASEVVRLLPASERLEVWGCHGFERRDHSGQSHYGCLTAETQVRLAEARQLAEDQELGGHLEAKPGCLALHWRGLPPASALELQRVARVIWSRFDGTAGLRLCAFDGGLELRSELAVKSTAVTKILTSLADSTAIAYLGDDLTDEDAFAALPPGALGVLVRPAWRETRAAAWVQPPAGLLDFLRRWRKIRERASLTMNQGQAA